MTAAALRHRTDGAISRGNDGSFGPRLCCVLGDVGVRFGGSEHHRIETSSSHTRPPPYGAGLPATGTGQAALFGALRATFHRGTATGTLRRAARTTSRGTATGTLRRAARTTSPGQGTRRSSEHQAPHSTGQGTRRSSEHQAPHPTGTGNRTSSEARHPIPRDREPDALRSIRHPTPRDREPDLFGGAAPHLTRQGTGPLRRRGTPPHPARAHGLVSKEPRPRGTANGALRSTARTAS
jgi:hypothetical protein